MQWMKNEDGSFCMQFTTMFCLYTRLTCGINPSASTSTTSAATVVIHMMMAIVDNITKLYFITIFILCSTMSTFELSKRFCSSIPTTQINHFFEHSPVNLSLSLSLALTNFCTFCNHTTHKTLISDPIERWHILRMHFLSHQKCSFSTFYLS